MLIRIMALVLVVAVLIAIGPIYKWMDERSRCLNCGQKAKLEEDGLCITCKNKIEEGTNVSS